MIKPIENRRSAPREVHTCFVALTVLLVSLISPLTARAVPAVFDETFNDDFAAPRTIPDGVDAARSSAFAPINACRPQRSGKLMITSRDISSFICAPEWRTSQCGPALGFEDGGGTFVTFHYSLAGTISSGSFVSFKVVGYGGDSGELFKQVSTDGANFTQVAGSTALCPMGSYVIPLPTGGTDLYFRLRIGAAHGLYDGIIVDDFHAVLFDTPQPPASLQEGGGNVCVFNQPPFNGTTHAHAIVLIDRTGSMMAPTANGTSTRCADSMVDALADINAFFASDPGGSLAVWTFASNSIVNATGGYVSQANAQAAVAALDASGCNGFTRLADAMCVASDALRLDFPTAEYGQMLFYMSTDGGENSSIGPCSGPWSVNGPPLLPYDNGSWEKKVKDKFLANQIVAFPAFFGRLGGPVATAAIAEAGAEAGTEAAAQPLRIASVNDSTFFRDLATSTGGVYTPMDDGPGVMSDTDVMFSHFGHTCATPGLPALPAASFAPPLRASSPKAVPSASTSSVGCLVACPAGDITFSVTVRDAANNPLMGSIVQVNFSGCGVTLPCSDVAGVTVNQAARIVSATSAPNGQASFPLRMGGTCGPGTVRVTADGIPLLTGAFASPDQDGNLAVNSADFFYFGPKRGTTDKTADFDCDGRVTPLPDVGVDETPPIDAPFLLRSLWPNPLKSGVLSLEIQQPTTGRLNLDLFDIAGRRVVRYTTEALGPGLRTLRWPVPAVRSGLYTLRLSRETGEVTKAQVIVLRP